MVKTFGNHQQTQNVSFGYLKRRDKKPQRKKSILEINFSNSGPDVNGTFEI